MGTNFKTSLLLFACVVLFTRQAQSQAFTNRQTWDGLYDIKMVASPSIEPGYVNATKYNSGTLQSDSVVQCFTILKTGNLMNTNNRYDMTSFNIPLSAIICPSLTSLCPEAYNVSYNSSCPAPAGKWSAKTATSTQTHMMYADYDDDVTTFSSSRASFSMSGCNSTMTKAYLYWFGKYSGTNSESTKNLAISTTSSYTGSGDVVMVPTSSTAFRSILFRSPDASGYSSVNALTTYTLGDQYVCVGDVTSFMQGVTQGGDVWVANVRSYLGKGNGGSVGGWALVVIYTSPNCPQRRITLFDGLLSLDKGTSNVVSLTGLQSPATSNFKSYIGFGCLDGENFAYDVTPESLEFTTGTKTTLINPTQPYAAFTKKGYPGMGTDGSTDAKDGCGLPDYTQQVNLTDGVSSSRITSYDEVTNTNGNEISRTPSCRNTLGIDVHHVLLPQGAIQTGVNSATLKFYAGSQGGTLPFLSYIAIERVQPKLEITKSANVSRSPLDAEIEYTLKVNNKGGLASLGANDLVLDTLDEGVDYVAGSCSISGTTYNTSDPLKRYLSVDLPVINPGDSITITFKVRVKDYTSGNNLWVDQCKRKILNTAWVDYFVPDGREFKTISNTFDCAFGSQTEVRIDDALLKQSNSKKIGPIDITTLPDSLIVANVKRILQDSAHVVADSIDKYFIYHKDSARVHPDSLFRANVAEQSFEAIKTYGSSGTCEDIYTITFVYSIPPVFATDSGSISCFGNADGKLMVRDTAGAGLLEYALVAGSITTSAQFSAATKIIDQTVSSKSWFSYSGLTAGTYTVVVTDKLSKLYFIPFNLTQPDKISLALGSDTVCVGETAAVNISSLTGRPSSTAWTYAWSSSADGTSWTALSPTTASVAVTPSITSYYQLIVKDGVCGDTASTNVVVYNLPPVNLGPDQTICQGTSAGFDAGSGMDAYAWNTGATSQTITANTAGIYVAKVTKNQCSSTDSVKLTVTALPVVNLGQDTAFCDLGILDAGSGFDSYAWSDGSSTRTLSVAETGTYNVTVTRNGCSSSDTISVTVYQTPSFDIGADTAICPSETVTLNAMSGANTYRWNTAETTQKISVNTAGTFSVTITLGTCTSHATRKVGIKPLPVLSVSGNSPICPLDSVSITISGAQVYLWDNGKTAANQTVKPTATTSYSVTGTLENCSDDTTFPVVVKPLPVVTASADTTICWGESTTISATGNTAQYSWDNTLGLGTSKLVSPVQNTTYHVTGTLDGCERTDSVLVTVNPKIIITPGKDTAICRGNSVSLVSLGNAQSYSWNNGLGSGSAHVVTPSFTTRYHVTAHYNSCDVNDSVLVTVNNLPTVSISASKTQLCYGDSVDLSGAGAEEYSWDNDVSNDKYFNPSQTATYMVTGTDANKCKDTASISITVHELPVVSISASDDTLCKGQPTKLMANGAATYAWDKLVVNGTDFVPEATDAFTVIGIDVYGCKDTATKEIVVHDLPTVDASATDSVICTGESISLHGIGADKYMWDNGVTDNSSFAPASSKTYRVTGTDSNGCQDTAQISITVHVFPVVNLGNDTAFCDQGTISPGNGLGQYVWNTAASLSTIQVTSPGNYSVTVTKDGCSSSDAISVTVYKTPIFTLGSDTAICPGESVTLQAISNADTYTWSTGQRSPSITATAAGTYSVTVTVGTCTASATRSVQIKPLPQLVVSGNSPICPGDSIRLTASGAQQFAWSNGGAMPSVSVSPSSTTPFSVTGTLDNCSDDTTVTVVVKPLPVVKASNDTMICHGTPGVISVTGTAIVYTWDQGIGAVSTMTVAPTTSTWYHVAGTLTGCQTSDSVLVSVNTKILLTLNSDTAICKGNNLTLTSSGNAQTYMWNNGLGTGASHVVSPAASAIYTVTAQYNGCEVTDSVEVVVHDLPEVIASATNIVVCYGSATQLTASGAVNYSWANGVVNGASFVPTATNTYFVTGTDARGCTDTSRITVTVNPIPVVAISGNAPLCTNQSETLTASGAVSFVWSTGETTSSITAVPVNNQSFSVTGTSLGCTSSASTTAVVYPYPVVNLGINDTVCVNDTKILSLSISGATYLWMDGSKASNRIVTAPGGLYYVDATVNGCTTRDSINVYFTELPDFSILGRPKYYVGDTAYYEVSKSFAAYLWNNNETKRFIRPVVNSDSTFWVQVTDEYQCKNSKIIEVKVYPRPVVNLNDTTICLGNSVTIQSKDSFDKYLWNTGDTMRSITVSSSGMYWVSATRINEPGIALIDTSVVTVVTPPTVRLGNDTAICQGNILTFGVSNQQNITYLWNTGAVTSSIQASSQGEYILTVTDIFKCSAVDSQTLVVYPIPDPPHIDGDSILCYNEPYTTLTASGSGEVAWFNNGSTASGNTLRVTIAIDDTVTVSATSTGHSCVSPRSQFSVRRLPNITGLRILVADTLLCVGKANSQIFNSTGTISGNRWTTTGDNKISGGNQGQTYVNIIFNDTGIDTVTLSTSDQYGCTYSTQQKVVVVPYPTAEFEYYSGNGQVVYINTTDSSFVDDLRKYLHNTYYWNFGVTKGAGVEQTNVSDTTILYKYGYFGVTLKAVNEAGCADSITKTVFVDMEYNIFVPNAFAPFEASPELNSFRPHAFGLQTYQIWIYDTWGNLLWYSNKLKNGQPSESWDGTYDGKTLKRDSYIWKIDAVFQNGKTWDGTESGNGKLKKFGNILLVR